MKHFLIADPEAVFSWPNLSHKSTEIYSIIDRFEKPMDPRKVHVWVTSLLSATANFRHATVPKNIFADLRTASKSDNELQQIFVDIYQSFEEAEKQLHSATDTKDRKILKDALEYCKTSVEKRMEMVKKDDRLIPFWEESKIKEYLKK